MRIGLLRHFEVQQPIPSGWITAQELARWRDDYDRAEVIPCPVELGGIPWKRCLASDLKRAWLTATTVFAGPIQSMKELREVQTDRFRTGGLRLPFGAWRWLARLAWLMSHPSQRAAKADFLARVRYLADQVIPRLAEDTLVVSHAGIMVFLRKELLRLGFAGPGFRMPRTGRLYVFEPRVAPAN